MQIIDGFEHIHNLSLALGFFDGIHCGHKAVIESAINYAKKNNQKSAVITFDIQPYCYFSKTKPKYILPRSETYHKIEQLGIDYIFIIDFDLICKHTAEEYIKTLIEYFSPIGISTGENHHLGKDNLGADFLDRIQESYNYKYFKIPSKIYDNKVISSSEIRNLLHNGEIEKANIMLDSNFCLSGTVQTGLQIGRTIGFPTVNITYPENLIEIPFGVYKSEIEFEGNTYSGISNFGTKPTVCKNCFPVLETHIFNFDQDLYEKYIKVNLLKKIRDEKKFATLEDLKKQILLDIEEAKA